MKVYVAHSSDFDYVQKLYIPIRNSSLSSLHEFFLPHEEGSFFNTKDIMPTFDVLVAEVSSPSTGEGIEIGRAEASGVPVVFIYEKGARVSSSLKFVSDTFIEYKDASDLLRKLEEHLSLSV